MFLSNIGGRGTKQNFSKAVGVWVFVVTVSWFTIRCHEAVQQQPTQPECQQSTDKNSLFPEKHPNLYQLVAQENLKSMTDVTLTGTEAGLRSSFKKLDDEGWAALVKARYESQMKMKPEVRRRLIFTLLSKYEEEHPVTQSSVMDQMTWQDLEFLCGPKSNLCCYLAAQLDRTVTEAGRATLYRKLVQPTVDRQQLENQQAIVAELVANETFFNELDVQLKELVEPENLLLSLWDDEDFFSFILEQNKIKLPFDSKVELINDVEKWLNRSPLILHVRGWSRYIIWRIGACIALYGVAALPIYELTGKNIVPVDEITGKSKIPFLPAAEDLKKIAPYTFLGALCLIINEIASKNLASSATSLSATYNTAEEAYYSWRDFWDGNVFGKCFHEKMVQLAKYINNLKTMAQAVSKNDVLMSRLPAVKQFNETLKTLGQKSSDMKFLLDLLATDTFKGEFSEWFGFGGRKFAAYLLLMDLKEQFVEAMMAIGELDAQLSIAKLYKEFKEKRVTFCFPSYDYACSAPAIDARDFWNPFIEPDKVVPSSLGFGQRYHSPSNIIVTGPNAGGKSTIIKALMINIILAQSFGIAPASSLTFTPFTKIITYLNITDDIAAGNSHFKAGVLRARDVLATVDGLKPDEFGLTAIDEVFNGTTFKEGQAAAYSLLKLLGASTQSMCVTCTHFPLIPTLEKETGQFVNYKVSVIEQPGQKIQYPYKLEPGISHQIITLKILQEEGFADRFLGEAERVLEVSAS